MSLLSGTSLVSYEFFFSLIVTYGHFSCLSVGFANNSQIKSNTQTNLVTRWAIRMNSYIVNCTIARKKQY